MATKSSALGKPSVVEAATPTLSKDSDTGQASIAMPEIEKSTDKTSLLDDPLETWLRLQAQSIIGKLPSLEEAKQLWQYVDINTRLPFPEPRRPGPLSRLMRALRAAGGMNKESANA